MFSATSIGLCTVIFFSVSLCDSLSKADESELKRDQKIAGIEDTGAEWGENGRISYDAYFYLCCNGTLKRKPENQSC